MSKKRINDLERNLWEAECYLGSAAIILYQLSGSSARIDKLRAELSDLTGELNQEHAPGRRWSSWNYEGA